jgi:hypothetical protein
MSASIIQGRCGQAVARWLWLLDPFFNAWHEVAPCPFCAALGVTLERDADNEACVLCCGCGARGPGNYRWYRAIDAWNRAAPPGWSAMPFQARWGINCYDDWFDAIVDLPRFAPLVKPQAPPRTASVTIDALPRAIIEAALGRR